MKKHKKRRHRLPERMPNEPVVPIALEQASEELRISLS
jgi:hypothetical protein